MVTTARMRVEYPELVPDVRQPRCNFAPAVPVTFPAGGPAYPSGRVTLRVHPACRQAFRALAAVMLHYGYEFQEPAGGTLACRLITGGSLSTLHAHGVALDINPSRNRYRVTFGGGLIQWGRQTDMPPQMVSAIEGIRTGSGQPIFEWGGRWFNVKDPMHFEVNVLRLALTTGVNLATVVGWTQYLAFESGASSGGEGKDGVIPIDAARVRPIVFRLQQAMNRVAKENLATEWEDLQLDGKCGPKTATAANRVRLWAGLEPVPTGIAFDGPTIAYLLGLYADDSDG